MYAVTQAIIILCSWVLCASYVALTGYLEARRLASGDFLNQDEGAAYDRQAETSGGLIGFGLIMFALAAAVLSAAGYFLPGLIGLPDPMAWALGFFALLLMPWVGVLAARIYVKGARWQRPAGIAIGSFLFIALAAAFTSQAQATAYWWLKIDHQWIGEVLANERDDRTDRLQTTMWDRLTAPLRGYVETWPDGLQFERVNTLYDDLEWLAIVHYPRSVGWSTGGIEQRLPAALDYLERFPNGRHLKDVLAQIDGGDLQRMDEMIEESGATVLRETVEPRVWEIAVQSKSVRWLLEYQARYPDGKYISQSMQRIETLRLDESIWQRAAASPTSKAIELFLKSYPGHKNEPDARARLQGLPFRELLARGQIQIDFAGCGIKAVCGRIRRLTEHYLVVRIPAGLLFKSSDPKAQSMATVETRTVTLPTKDWKDVELPAGCADIDLKIPQKHVRFSFDPLAQDQQLANIRTALDSEEAGYATRQAMLWIVRSDTGLRDLQRRLTGTSTVNNVPGTSSVIKKQHIAAALDLLSAAGYPAEQTRAAKDLAAD